VTTRPGPLPAGRPRDALVRTVGQALDTAGLAEGDGAIVAISGGPDSTALAYLVAEARPDLLLTLGHVRHGLREDHEDLEVVTRHASWLGVPLVVREVEVVPRGRGIEDAAREARHGALAAIATEVGARWVLLGHHADDQAETVLLRVARGTGSAGLGAMAPVRDRTVRPLLRLRRADLRRFVEGEGLPAVEDPTNTDPAVRRSIVRHDLLPGLGRVGPDPVAALARLADLARDDDAALDAWADDVLERARRRVGDVLVVPDRVLAEVPVAVARRVVRRLLETVALAAHGEAADPPSTATVTRVLELATGRTVHLPRGVHASAGGGWRAVFPAGDPAIETVALAVPGETRWRAAGIRFVVSTPDSGPPVAATAGQIAFELPEAWSPPPARHDPGAVPPGGHRERLHLVLPSGHPPVHVRVRRPGDRIATTVGTRRLQDVYVDAGLPRPVRDRWPVLVVDDRPVWVPGLVADATVVAAGREAPGALVVCERLPARTSH
jgi:tRNA(Ile)-lysidine synthase